MYPVLVFCFGKNGKCDANASICFGKNGQTIRRIQKMGYMSVNSLTTVDAFEDISNLVQRVTRV